METRESALARVERLLDLGLLLVGAALILLMPATRISLQPSMLVVWGGVALLGSGLVRDLARLALGERKPIKPPPQAGPKEFRICLESALGGLAVGGGLGWTIMAPGAPQPIGLGTFVFALALVATFGHLSRNVIVAFRIDAAHRNILPWS